MDFNKIIFLTFVLSVGFISSKPIDDWCPPCKRIIKDFAPVLKTTDVQNVEF
jgi:hypothetical protein